MIYNDINFILNPIEYKKLIKKEVNEAFILTIINQSNKIFNNNHFHLVYNQARSEPDFMCQKTGYELDATIALSRDTCQKISHFLNNEININLLNEILKNDLNTIKRRIIKKVIYKNKNVIVFIPSFNSISNDNSYIDDYLNLFNEIKNAALLNNKDVYILEFGINNKMVIRKLNDNTLEEINYPLSKRFIKVYSY